MKNAGEQALIQPHPAESEALFRAAQAKAGPTGSPGERAGGPAASEPAGLVSGRRRGLPGMSVWLPLLAGIAFIAAWQLQGFHRLFDLKKYQLPLPSAIAEAIRENFGLLLSYTGYTLTEAALGMLAGSTLGFLVALAATAWPKWGSGSLLLTAALNAVPIVALAPIMNLWFGDGIASRAAIVAATTMAAMALNACKGLTAIDPLALDLMRSYAASKPQVFRYLRIQASLPYVFTALKINATASMIGAMVGEFFFSSRGLGYLLSNSVKIAKMPLGWSCIVLAAAAGIVFYLLIERLERFFLRWHPSQRI
ncbi:MAG: ABC transporter permease [Paenibacillus sp.]|uniref:ABC transporter permease n=1 Tax=Paenibacillus sp. TaxID=58172 RepID=UPI00290534DD|nr:ABC transporter permease [Paenibacillus sp.]MDU2240056.1 ABC transporter permease [Paenibacillus sp.]